MDNPSRRQFLRNATLLTLHRRMLERIRAKFGLEKLGEPVMQELNLVWHKR
ncbi:MAG: hypothetical protein ABI619_04895 [Betaproteobacteria bacterium]